MSISHIENTHVIPRNSGVFVVVVVVNMYGPRIVIDGDHFAIIPRTGVRSESAHCGAHDE